MTHRFMALSTLFLLVTVIKNLSKVVMQQYNYLKLIWMKQNISFACSNYRSNWQLIDNFCLHLSELSHIETQRKRIVNRIMTSEPWCTVNLVNRFTSRLKSYFHFSVWVKILPKMKINWVKLIKLKERAQKKQKRIYSRYLKDGISLYPIKFMIVFVIWRLKTPIMCSNHNRK